MEDLLFVSFDRYGKENDSEICVGRCNANNSHTILKMILGEKAETLYKALTSQNVEAVIRYRGHWITNDFTKVIKCNICDADAEMSTLTGEQYKSRYCPSCGAYMWED